MMSYKNQNQNTERKIRIGDVYLIHFDGVGNEQKGFRPGLIFQNNLGNIHVFKM